MGCPKGRLLAAALWGGFLSVLITEATVANAVAAATNVLAVHILKKDGHPVGFSNSVKNGLPFAVISVVAAGLFAWLICR